MASTGPIRVEIDVRNLDEVKAALEELERHRAHEERAARALSEIEHFQGMTRKDLARVILRVEEHLRNAEAQLGEYLEQIEAYERATEYTPAQIVHIDSCDECGILPPQAPEFCNEYREIGK